MKNSPIRWIVCAFVVMSIAGCGSDPQEDAKKRVTGKWQAYLGKDGKPTSDASDSALTMDIEFTADGKLNWEPFGFSGTWEVKSVDGDTVTLKTMMETSKKIRGGDGPDAGKTLESKTEEQELILKFQSDNEATLTMADDPKDPLSIKRKTD